MLKFQTAKTEFLFFMVFAFLIVYSNTYPFHFHGHSPILELIKNHGFNLGFKDPGELVVTFILYAMFGFLGIRALVKSNALAVASLLATGLFMELLLQGSHLFIYTRVPSMTAVIAAVLGIFSGSVMGRLDRLRFLGGRRSNELWLTAPLVIACCWTISRIVPAIPSPHLSDLTHSIKDLLLVPDISFHGFAQASVAWTLFFHMISSSQQRAMKTSHCMGTVLTTFILVVMVDGRMETISTAAGGIFAMVIWAAWLKGSPRRPVVLLILLWLMLTIDGLWPFHFSAGAGEFTLLPFDGFLSNPVLAGTITLLEKLFFLGSLAWLMEETGTPWKQSTLFLLAWASLLETAQLHLPGRTFETTDPVVLLCITLWIKKYRTQKKKPPGGEPETDRRQGNPTGQA
jgi:VanZ family protein